MKKLYVFFILSFSFLVQGKAQFNRYFRFPDSNAYWGQSDYWLCFSCTTSVVGNSVYNYYVRGDTIVQGKEYSKVNVSGGFEYSDPPTYPDTVWQCYNSLICLIRNDTLGEKVYASFSPTYGQDTLLYDFNLKVGDTLPDSYINQYSWGNQVVAIDSILVGTTYRRQFIIAQDTGMFAQKYDSIVEGIGSWLGLLNPIMPPFEGGSYLNCFIDSTITYPKNSNCMIFYTCPAEGVDAIEEPVETISIFPNPNSGKFTISLSQSELISGPQTIAVYNVLGQPVMKELLPSALDDKVIDLAGQPNGIYLYRVVSQSGELIGDGKLIIQK